MVDIDLKKRTDTWPKDIIDYDDKIKIRNATVAKQVLSNFGHLIQKLQLIRIYPETDDSYRSIYKLVNLHCSKTLKEIRLDSSVNNLLNEFTNQFENVENVIIRSDLNTDRRLNEIFPSVRRLEFMTWNITITDSINVKYENLEHLELYINGPLKGELAAELIRKNSHIRNLTLTRASPKLIKIAADSLPQLEKLTLDHIENKYNNESIVFANVKIFEAKGNCVKSLFQNNIKFTNVEEFYTDDLVENMFGETGFFATNKNLKKLELVSKYLGRFYENDAIIQLAHTITTLQHISINKADWVEVETILELIKNNKQLQKLQLIFHFVDYRKTTLEALSRKIDDKWSMEAFSDTIILKK